MFNQLRCRWQPLLTVLIALALVFSSQPGLAGAAGGQPPVGGQVNWAATSTASRQQKPAALMAAADRNHPQQTARLASAAATTYYYYAVSVGTWLEPNDYAHRNYCGPAATQVALDARLPATSIPHIDTIGREENIDPNWGVYASAIQRVLNTRLNTSWYITNGASGADNLGARIRTDLYYGFALVTGVKTSGMPGWGSRNVNHIVTSYAYYRATDGSGDYVAYTETAGSVAGYTGAYRNLVSLASFWRYVQNNNVQVW